MPYLPLQDYPEDNCLDRFTVGQAAVMQAGTSHASGLLLLLLLLLSWLWG